jgi:hypothetical protein
MELTGIQTFVYINRKTKTSIGFVYSTLCEKRIQCSVLSDDVIIIIIKVT